jgi:hypothetical protein
MQGHTDDPMTDAEIAADDIGPNDGSLAREMFADEDYMDRFQSGQPMDENDY